MPDLSSLTPPGAAPATEHEYLRGCGIVLEASQRLKAGGAVVGLDDDEIHLIGRAMLYQMQQRRADVARLEASIEELRKTILAQGQDVSSVRRQLAHVITQRDELRAEKGKLDKRIADLRGALVTSRRGQLADAKAIDEALEADQPTPKASPAPEPAQVTAQKVQDPGPKPAGYYTGGYQSPYFPSTPRFPGGMIRLGDKPWPGLGLVR